MENFAAKKYVETNFKTKPLYLLIYNLSIHKMMTLSDWSVSVQGNFSRKGSLFVNRAFHIVYLEDHKLFSDAVSEYCIKPFFPLVNFTILANGDDAYAYIKRQIDKNSRIDLFITDINHPGVKGAALIKMIRQYEKEKGDISRIPIMVLTMMAGTFVPQLVEGGMDMVDRYFSKSAEANEIIDCIEGILY